MKKVYSFYLAKYLPIIMLFLFSLDSIGTVLSFYDSSFNRVSIFFRFLFFIAVIFILIKNIHINKIYQDFILLLLLLFIYLLGTLPFVMMHYGALALTRDIIAYSKFLYFLVIISVIPLILYKVKDIHKVKIMYEWIVLITSLAIIFGFLFHIDLFKSYGDVRFGYKGVIYAVNETGFFFLIAYLYLLIELFAKKVHGVLFILVPIAAILTGTKAAFLGIVISSFIYVLLVKRRLIIYFIFAFTCVVFLMVYLFHTYASMFDWFIYSLTQSDLITVFLSGRDKYIIDRFLPLINDWGVINYLFGGVNLQIQAVEMDFFDLFSQLGLCGFLLYFLFIIKKMLFSSEQNINMVFLLSILVYAFFAGHVFYSALNALYCGVLIAIMKGNESFYMKKMC